MISSNPVSGPRDKALNGAGLSPLAEKADTGEFLRKKNTAVRLASAMPQLSRSSWLSVPESLAKSLCTKRVSLNQAWWRCTPSGLLAALRCA